MIRLTGLTSRLCDGVTRRDLLQVGALGSLGLSLPFTLQAQAKSTARTASADAVILIYCWGAPSQFELWNPKPDAPDEVRGEFGVVQTTHPGIILGERIPELAKRTSRYALVRTCEQSSTSHQPGAYEALTGFAPRANAVSLIASSTDYPSLGSVVSKLRPNPSGMPPFVTLPQLISDVGNLTPGQFSGFLGRRYDPLTVLRDPNVRDFRVDELALPAEVPLDRLDDRRRLMAAVDGQLRGLQALGQGYGPHQERAFRLLASSAVKQAFDLNQEKPAQRERYGRHTYGQSCLLARRLVEAGVKLVTVFSANNGKTPQDAWDTHADNFRKLKQLCPSFDQGTSALLDDLQERGLAKRTLLVIMSEFGRTPKISANAGREHWSKCYSIVLSGGGIRDGQVYGQSDKIGAYPTHGRVFQTADLTATIFHCLGIDPHTEVADQAGRPLPISTGRPMSELF